MLATGYTEATATSRANRSRSGARTTRPGPCGGNDTCPYSTLRRAQHPTSLPPDTLGRRPFQPSRLSEARAAPTSHRVRPGVAPRARRQPSRQPTLGGRLADEALFVGWFWTMAIAPRPFARRLAPVFLFPERRRALNRVLARLQKPNRTSIRQASTDRNPATPASAGDRPQAVRAELELEHRRDGVGRRRSSLHCRPRAHERGGQQARRRKPEDRALSSATNFELLQRLSSKLVDHAPRRAAATASILLCTPSARSTLRT